ncbi:hypothetical protein M413DRAFT_31819 [Hebeloma cylindrosporum]|uniref:Uncharacterized protein n=1 Tax=Hebeloma cylindrosporum TaxID=76867 RepID=A0A0C3BHM6_HEBCY|nr:hypothetical protein M413DRAFT_31819 [Hebeloma cylindrosporum h7]
MFRAPTQAAVLHAAVVQANSTRADSDAVQHYNERAGPLVNLHDAHSCWHDDQVDFEPFRYSINGASNVKSSPNTSATRLGSPETVPKHQGMRPSFPGALSMMAGGCDIGFEGEGTSTDEGGRLMCPPPTKSRMDVQLAACLRQDFVFRMIILIGLPHSVSRI